MLLNIPVLDLLHSQLDIAVNPLSGKLTCNIRDIPSQLWQCHSLHASDLVLTLQSSLEEGRNGTLCVRLSPAQVSVSGYSPVNMFEAFPSHGLFDQSDHAAHSVIAEPLFLVPHAHDSFGHMDSTNVMFSHSCDGPGSLDALLNQESLWTSPQEKLSLQSNESRDVSPVSQELSQICSDTIVEDLQLYSSPAMYAFSDSQHSATGYLGANATYHRSPVPVNNMMDIQGHREITGSNANSASCFPIMDLFAPTSHSEPLCQTSSAATSPKHDQITLDSHTSTPSPSHAPNHERSTTPPSPSQHNSPAEPAQEGKRELYPCPFPSCHRILKSPYTRQIHLKTHDAKPQKNFPCTLGCSESFTRHHDRLRHEVAQHGKQCEFSCKRCERFFSSQRMLDRHTCWSWRNGSLRWQLKDFADSSRSDA